MGETLILIKPDAFEKGCVDDIFDRFLKNNFEMTAMKKITATPSMVDRHYEKKFSEVPHIREEVITYMTSGSVIAIIFERHNAISDARSIIGPLINPPPGTIRGDFPTDILRNLIHSSNSSESAKHEISLWFNDSDNKNVFGQLTMAEYLFVLTTIFQKEGFLRSAATAAALCLEQLSHSHTYKETASGHVIRCTGHTICLPDFLHTETATKRFKEIGIVI